MSGRVLISRLVRSLIMHHGVSKKDCIKIITSS